MTSLIMTVRARDLQVGDVCFNPETGEDIYHVKWITLGETEGEAEVYAEVEESGFLTDRVFDDGNYQLTIRRETAVQQIDVLYISLDGKDKRSSWARSNSPMETVILDYDKNDQLIGIELLGSAARAAIEAVNGLALG